jgi:hypothetical protein
LTDRIRPALGVYVFGVLGVFLAAAPWTAFWDEATYVLLPAWGACVRSGWVRGAVSGLGLVDLAVAGREAAALWRSLRSGGAGEGP